MAYNKEVKIMAGSFLKRVVKYKQIEVEKAKKRMPFEKLLDVIIKLPPVRNFRDALYRSQRISLIAEIKKKNPSQPSWKPRIQLKKLIESYLKGGAFAISVVTDEKYFGGKLNLIAEIKKTARLPILRKDFIIDPYQVYESRAAQADALLLIAELLPQKELGRFIELTSGMGMTPVVEVNNTTDLKRAVRLGADVVLINNRNLNTLKVDTKLVDLVAKAEPRDTMVIAASGYKTPEEVAAITSNRVKAVLIGRTLIGHKKPAEYIREILVKAEKL